MLGLYHLLSYRFAPRIKDLKDRKLSVPGPSNALFQALWALFILQWLFDLALRQRSHSGLNKGEASNALRRAVFFHRQGQFRDRTFKPSFRASGLSLLTAAIVHWNTIYLDQAVQQFRSQGARQGRVRASQADGDLPGSARVGRPGTATGSRCLRSALSGLAA